MTMTPPSLLLLMLLAVQPQRVKAEWWEDDKYYPFWGFLFFSCFAACCFQCFGPSSLICWIAGHPVGLTVEKNGFAKKFNKKKTGPNGHLLASDSLQEGPIQHTVQHTVQHTLPPSAGSTGATNLSSVFFRPPIGPAVHVVQGPDYQAAATGLPPALASSRTVLKKNQESAELAHAPAQAPEFVVFVKTLTGQEIKVTLTGIADATVFHVSAKVAEELAVPMDQQRLLFGQQDVLEPSRTLQSYGICSGSVLHLALKMAPGSSK
eukprot:COSAG05_NODE_4401_length_1529_cov_156.725175_2_plen_264_part_00